MRGDAGGSVVRGEARDDQPEQADEEERDLQRARDGDEFGVLL